MDVHAYLAERRALVDGALEAAIPPSEVPPARLHAAMRHLHFPGGKRLRPALAMAACEAAGAPTAAALPAAAAAELIHTYSMIHDDLPCMDDDRERRGRATVHVLFGDALAVLAGDALLAAAFQVLADEPGETSAQRRLAAALDFARASGSGMLVGGQADDLALAAEKLDPARIESVHRRKTAALIAASITGGARLGGADAATVERLRRFGESLGVAFQIADDLLDVGSDAECSLVRALGPEEAAERAEALLDSALGELEPLAERAEPLRELARLAVRRKK